MKRLAPWAAAAVVLLSIQAATASPEDVSKSTPPRKPLAAHCTAQAFRPFSHAVWALEHWERGKPHPKAIAAYRRRLRCAPPLHRKAMKHRWREDKRVYYEHRHYKLRWGNCTDAGPILDCIHGAAITYHVDQGWMEVVMWCESGGNRWDVNASSGATSFFQYLPSTWQTTPYRNHSIYSAKWQSLATAWMMTQGRQSEWVCPV